MHLVSRNIKLHMGFQSQMLLDGGPRGWRKFPSCNVLPSRYHAEPRATGSLPRDYVGGRLNRHAHVATQPWAFLFQPQGSSLPSLIPPSCLSLCGAKPGSDGADSEWHRPQPSRLFEPGLEALGFPRLAWSPRQMLANLSCPCPCLPNCVLMAQARTQPVAFQSLIHPVLFDGFILSVPPLLQVNPGQPPGLSAVSHVAGTRTPGDLMHVNVLGNLFRAQSLPSASTFTLHTAARLGLGINATCAADGS